MRMKTLLKLEAGGILVALLLVMWLATMQSDQVNQWLAVGFMGMCAWNCGRQLARIQKKIRATPRHHLVAGDPFTDWSSN